MRLIYADDFKKFMQALCKAGAPYESVVELLDKQPTAYDIDKVVDELEELADNSNDHMYESYFDGKEDGIREAIEIVKQGGVGKVVE